ncbi:uncharacterized protein [Elaeis guineensis]|uniref:Protein Jade-1 n=1 Tax=Elaeis guineensis var. tenera TaxID=51953 RepID=A0A6I9QYG0_ELAGV|nr:protein Jade-1 [Elaeis guineensis]
MENSFHGLPPSKRFKLLHLQENPHPSDSPMPECLPAKKRLDHILHHHHYPISTTSLCLPAKKRVWAPHLSPLKHQHEDPNPICPQSHLQSQDDEEPSKQQDDDQEEEDDGVTCAVCRSTDGDPVDPIVFCDGCDLMVHASCYGDPLIKSIPEGDWFCLRCCERKGKEEEGEEKPSCCCLCPVKGGAVKPTTDGGWAHIMCALLVPEVFFRDPDGRDGIDCSRVPGRRRDIECYICGSNRGCAIECSEPKCGLGFHVSCGLEKGLSIEYKEGRGGAIVAGFCVDHTQLWKKQQITGKFKIVPRDREPKGKTRF